MNIKAVAYYVAKARSGESEGVFHGLRELSHDALPAVQAAYHNEVDPIVRDLLVEAIWQHRQLSVIDFLTVVLRDPAPSVWKQALDGLVALASPASIHALQSALDRETDPGRREWIEEAIDQASENVARQPAP